MRKFLVRWWIASQGHIDIAVVVEKGSKLPDDIGTMRLPARIASERMGRDWWDQYGILKRILLAGTQEGEFPTVSGKFPTLMDAELLRF